MPIQGPLRELGLHEVFQLLGLSQKTGVLTVTSAARTGRGTLVFHRGSVTGAALGDTADGLGDFLVRRGQLTPQELKRAQEVRAARRNTCELGAILVELGVLTQRELERHVRAQAEDVVFELMSWRSGHFTFEERPPAEEGPAVRISSESLLMEAARRRDEWSRIEQHVRSLSLVPVLAPARTDQPPALDLGPREWEVLAAIDNQADLRAIAARVGYSDFDVGVVTYGLLCAGLVELRESEGTALPQSSDAWGSVAHLEESRTALRTGAVERALAAARAAVAATPHAADARLVLARALARNGEHAEAVAELRCAVRLDALNAEVHRDLGYAAARAGDLAEAVVCWKRYLRILPEAPDAPQVRAAVDAVSRLHEMLHEQAYV